MAIPITKRGYQRMKEELSRLKKVERPHIIVAIAEARAHGDLSENAEYHAAREKQSFIEGRIAELEGKIADAEVIDLRNLSTEKVVFGTTVHLMDSETGEEKQYMIVGMEEADLKAGKISVQSPLGKALIGHRVGDLVPVITPAKKMEYSVVNITVDVD